MRQLSGVLALVDWIGRIQTVVWLWGAGVAAVAMLLAALRRAPIDVVFVSGVGAFVIGCLVPPALEDFGRWWTRRRASPMPQPQSAPAPPIRFYWYRGSIEVISETTRVLHGVRLFITNIRFLDESAGEWVEERTFHSAGPFQEHELDEYRKPSLFYKDEHPFRVIEDYDDDAGILIAGRRITQHGMWMVSIRCEWLGQTEPLIEHFFLTWNPGERPTVGQWDAA